MYVVVHIRKVFGGSPLVARIIAYPISSRPFHITRINIGQGLRFELQRQAGAGRIPANRVAIDRVARIVIRISLVSTICCSVHVDRGDPWSLAKCTAPELDSKDVAQEYKLAILRFLDFLKNSFCTLMAIIR